MMQTWENRALEEASLFNPAFCAILLAKTAGDFKKKSQVLYSFPLSFLVLPIVLHQKTRNSLPGTTVTGLLPWIQEHKELLIDFSTRVQQLQGITRESIMFGLAHDILSMNENGDLGVGTKWVSPTEKRTELFTAEVWSCIDKAGFVGRWFAGAGTTATIYSAWGIKP